MIYYLAREGVAFGPYSEFQVRESVRLGIFNGTDFALAENGAEWLTVAALLSAEPSAPVDQPGEPKGLVLSAEKSDDENSRLTSKQNAYRNRPSGGRMLSLAAIPLAIALCTSGVWAMKWHSASSNAAEKPTAHLRSRSIPDARAAQSAITLSVGSREPTLVPETAAVTALVQPQAETNTPPASLPVGSENPVQIAPEQNLNHSLARRQIEGQIFIAARDGRNYEPPSVEVRLYPLALLKPYLEKRGTEASAKFEELKTQIVIAEGEKELLRKAANSAFDAYIQAAPDDRRALEQASTDAKKARERATNAYYNLIQDREDLLSGAFYLEDLPKSLSVTRTDDQGRFNFDVPASGEFAVVAGAQRGTDDATERYYWFVPVSNADEPRKTVLLSNNNVSSHGSTDSLIQTAD